MSDSTSAPADETNPDSKSASSPAAVTESDPPSPDRPSSRFRFLSWLDLLIVLVLFVTAFPIRWTYTTGDFWLDEADYAFAAVRGFQANRWDIPDSPAEPEKLVRLRHYHPPMVAHVMGIALHYGSDDRTLRTPFVLAGCTTVSLLYLCGVSLFSQTRLRLSRKLVLGDHFAPRIIAFACAVVLLVTPSHLRASSHALPWSFITLWLLALLWTMLKLAETAKPAWLCATGLMLGALFVTSEYAIPALLAIGVSLPFAAWPLVASPSLRKPGALCLVGGIGLFLVVAFVFWPAGLFGGILKMLHHYVEMANDPWQVTVRGVSYMHAPKTAYLIWYWDYFRRYLLFYALAIPGALVLLVAGRGRKAMLTTLMFTGVVLAVAHKSHIIGPEYLVHALPLLTLLGGTFFMILAGVQWIVGGLVVLLAGSYAAKYHDPSILSGMDIRSRHPRWPEAARYIAKWWKPWDRMLAPSYGGVGRWYVLHVGNVEAKEWQIQGLPVGMENTSKKMLTEIQTGVYRFIAVGSTFADYYRVDPRVAQELRHWQVVWQSDEGGEGSARLTIYQYVKPAVKPTGIGKPPIPDESK